MTGFIGRRFWHSSFPSAKGLVVTGFLVAIGMSSFLSDSGAAELPPRAGAEQRSSPPNGLPMQDEKVQETGLLNLPREGVEASPDDGIASAIVQLEIDIGQATDELNGIRDVIALQRLPLAERLESVRRTVAEQRATLARLHRLRDRGEKEQEALQAETVFLEERRRDLRMLFSEYAQGMETRMHAAEGPVWARQLRPLDQTLAGQCASQNLGSGIAALLDLAEEWNRKRLGGHTFTGVALDSGGTERTGDFAVFGPLAWFRTDDGMLSGPVFTQPGHVLPVVRKTLSKEESAAVAQILAGRTAVLPVDVTGGDAIKVEQARISLVAQARTGGLVMIPLLLVALVAVVLAVWKSIELNRLQVCDGDAVVRIVGRIQSGDSDGACRSAGHLKEPMASLVGALITHRHATPVDLEEILHEKVLAALPRMERHLGTLAVLGGVAPLLGLLGTVTGMIHTFQLVTVFGSGDARLLSGGISEALTTTAFGLLIAIPVLLVHAMLVRRTRGMVGVLEQTAANLLNAVLRQCGEVSDPPHPAQRGEEQRTP